MLRVTYGSPHLHKWIDARSTKNAEGRTDYLVKRRSPETYRVEICHGGPEWRVGTKDEAVHANPWIIQIA